MTETTAVDDADAMVREIDFPIRNFQDSTSHDRRTRERFYEGVFKDLQLGFTVLDETPLKPMLSSMYQYAAAAQALSGAEKERFRADTFNGHGFVEDSEMGETRAGLTFLRPQPDGVERNPHAFRNDESPNLDIPLPGVTACLDQASDQSIIINRTVLRAVAYGFGKPLDFFDRTAEEIPLTDNRLFSTPPSGKSILLNPHMDFGLTTITHSKTPGLQVKIDDHTYVPVFPGEGRIVVLVGKALEVAAGLKARTHRVAIEDPDAPRTSITFFQAGSVSAPMPFIDSPDNKYLLEYPNLLGKSAADISFFFWVQHNKTEMDASIAFDEKVLERLEDAP